TPKNKGKAQHVVDLIGIVGTSGAKDGIRAGHEGNLGPNFGLRIGEREDQRIVRHVRDHLGVQNAAGRQAEEKVGTGYDVGERARLGVLRVAYLFAVHLRRAALVDDAVNVGDKHVLAPEPEGDQQIETSKGGGAGTGDDDGRAVLVVMKDGYFHALAQLALDDEALGRLDVFEIDAAEGGLERGDDVDDPLGICGIDFDVEHVDTGELLKEAGLAFHHRFASQGTDV